jgi:hypothetical protein
VYHPFMPLVPLAVISTAGGVVSYLRGKDESVVLPATSAHEPETEMAALSGPEYKIAGSQVSIPDVASVPLKLIETGWLYQPFESGGRTAEAITIGPVASRRTVMGAVLALNAAALVQEPVKTMPVVSVVWNWSGVQTTGALSVSEPDIEIVTSPMYQPLDPGVPLEAMAAVGGVLSMLIPAWVLDAVLPALSAQVPLADCPTPSDVSIWVMAEAAAPDVASMQFHATVTFVLFQPFKFGAV